MLRFLTDPAVPFTNTEAERDGRMMKLRQKISGGVRSEDSARDFAIIRSLIATAKQGWNIIHALARTWSVSPAVWIGASNCPNGFSSGRRGD